MNNLNCDKSLLPPFSHDVCRKALIAGLNSGCFREELKRTVIYNKQTDVDYLERLLLYLSLQHETRRILCISMTDVENDCCRLQEIYNDFLRRGLSRSDIEYRKEKIEYTTSVLMTLDVHLSHFTIRLRQKVRSDKMFLFSYLNLGSIECSSVTPLPFRTSDIVSLLLWTDAVYEEFMDIATAMILELQRKEAALNIQYSAAKVQIRKVMKSVKYKYQVERQDESVCLYVDLPRDNRILLEFPLDDYPCFDKLRFHLQNLKIMFDDFSPSVTIEFYKES